MQQVQRPRCSSRFTQPPFSSQRIPTKSIWNCWIQDLHILPVQGILRVLIRMVTITGSHPGPLLVHRSRDRVSEADRGLIPIPARTSRPRGMPCTDRRSSFPRRCPVSRLPIHSRGPRNKTPFQSCDTKPRESSLTLILSTANSQHWRAPIHVHIPQRGMDRARQAAIPSRMPQITLRMNLIDSRQILAFDNYIPSLLSEAGEALTNHAHQVSHLAHHLICYP